MHTDRCTHHSTQYLVTTLCRQQLATLQGRADALEAQAADAETAAAAARASAARAEADLSELSAAYNALEAHAHELEGRLHASGQEQQQQHGPGVPDGGGGGDDDDMEDLLACLGVNAWCPLRTGQQPALPPSFSTDMHAHAITIGGDHSSPRTPRQVRSKPRWMRCLHALPLSVKTWRHCWQMRWHPPGARRRSFCERCTLTGTWIHS